MALSNRRKIDRKHGKPKAPAKDRMSIQELADVSGISSEELCASMQNLGWIDADGNITPQGESFVQKPQSDSSKTYATDAEADFQAWVDYILTIVSEQNRRVYWVDGRREVDLSLEGVAELARVHPDGTDAVLERLGDGESVQQLRRMLNS